MTFAAGDRIGPYEIIGPLGEGGMGEVYRATDTNLKRAVALKVLPAAVAEDPDRLARFQREAELLASLNHPNIAGVYGLERITTAQGVRRTALVMELVEGPTLADRLKHEGALPLADTLAIARQMAEALEAAHDLGIVHRDLKPANVKVRQDGAVKVLDFGLAKAVDPAAATRIPPSELPTMTSPAMTQVGVVLGTAAYMSPEQAAGKRIDKRSDIWSFGVVLWEMLTGRVLFDGESVAHTLADVLRAEIPFAALPASTPPALRTLLRRCLDRDVRSRLRDIGEARVVLQQGPASRDQAPAGEAPSTATARAAGPSPVVAAIAGAAAALVLAVPAFYYSRPAVPQPTLLQVDLGLPEGVTIPPPGPPRLALSDDGTRLAFVGIGQDGQSRLWVRNLQTGSTLEVQGTEGADAPVWSPDGRWLAFNVADRIMRVDAMGGSPMVVASEGQRGLRWNRAGMMIVSGADGNIVRLPPGGGQPQAVLQLDRAGGEVRQIPIGFLPDGQRFLYQSQRRGGAVEMVGSLSGGTPRELMRTGPAPAVFAPKLGGNGTDGWLLYVSQRQLFARPFDAASASFTGDERMLVNDVPNGPIFSISSTGLLAYVRGETSLRDLSWYGRNGAPLSTVVREGQLSSPRLSPDGRFIAYVRDQRAFVHEIARNLSTPIGMERTGRLMWTPDGRFVLLDVIRDGTRLALAKPADGSPGDRVWAEWTTGGLVGVLDVSRDGRTLLSLDQDGTSLIAADSGQRTALTAERLIGGSFSPDGRWVLAGGQSGGRFEVYAIPVPSAWRGALPARVQISTAGGTQPYWAPNGREIYYVSADLKMVAVPVEFDAGVLRPGMPQPLFETRLSSVGDRQYDVSGDGQRFLLAQSSPTLGQAQVSVIVNWQRMLEE